MRPTVHGALHTAAAQNVATFEIKTRKCYVQSWTKSFRRLDPSFFFLFMTLVLIGVSLIVWGSSCGVIVCVGLDEGTNAFNN